MFAASVYIYICIHITYLNMSFIILNVYMYICIHICTYIYIYMRIYIYIYVYIYICIYIYSYVYTIHTPVYIVYIYIHMIYTTGQVNIAPDGTSICVPSRFFSFSIHQLSMEPHDLPPEKHSSTVNIIYVCLE